MADPVTAEVRAGALDRVSVQYSATLVELDHVDLLTSGAALPLTGFGGPDAPLRLQLPGEVARQAVETGGGVEIVDPEGAPIAILRVDATYPGDAGRVGVVGDVVALGRQEYGAFRSLFLSPSQIEKLVGPEAPVVPVASPLAADEVAAIARTVGDRPVLLLVMAGRSAGEHSSASLIRASLEVARDLPAAHVAAVSVSPSDGRELKDLVLRSFARGEILAPGGSEESALDATNGCARAEQARGLVVFFTGLSGSGKSTLARALHDRLLATTVRPVTDLDGDIVRKMLSDGLGFSPADRARNVRRIGWVAAEIGKHGGIAICSVIAPTDGIRREVRRMVEANNGEFLLVHVATPLEECERRDRKGLYAKARRGEIPEFTGISSPYEEPIDADIRVDTTGRSIDDVLHDLTVALAGVSSLREVIAHG